MKKNTQESIINIILYFYVALLPILDICKYFYGNIEIFGISVIEIINILFCSTMFCFVLLDKFKKNGKFDKKVILFSFILIIYLILHLFNVFTISYSSERNVNCIIELYYIIRCYILPFFLLYVIYNIDQNKDKIYKTLSMLSFFIALVIVVTNLLEIGSITYDSYFDNDYIVYGSILDWKNDITIHNFIHYTCKGIFASGNQISLIMLSLLVISSLYLIKENKWYLYISFIIKCISMIIISTKTSVFGVFIVLIFSIAMLILLKLLNKNSNIFKNIIYFILVLICLILIFSIAPFSYKVGINKYEYPRNLHLNKNDGKSNDENIDNKSNDKNIDNISSNPTKKYICGFENTNEYMSVSSEVTSLNLRKYIYNVLLNSNSNTNEICKFLEENELTTILQKNSFSKQEKKILIELISSYSSFFGIHNSLIEFLPVNTYFDFWIKFIKNEANINNDFRHIKRLMGNEYVNSNFNPIMGKLFGVTYISEFPSIENDVVTQNVWFGIVGTLLLVIPFYILFIYYALFFVIRFDKRKLFEESYVLCSIFLILSVSILSGHWFGDMFSMTILVLLLGLCHTLKKEKIACHGNKKKILFIIWSFTTGGGAEKVLANLVNNIDNKKYEVSVLEYWHTNIKTEKTNSNVKILKPVVNSIKEPLLLRKLKEICLKYCPNILRIFYARDNYDVEIAFNYMFPTFLVREDVESYAWFHGDIYDLKSNRYNYYLQKRSLKKFNKVITISKNSYNSIIDVFPRIKNNVVMINNGLSEKTILNLSREEINCTEKNYYLYVGRLDNNKNPLFLLDIASIIKEKKSKFKIKIMGTGELYDKLKKEIEKRNLSGIVELLGYIENPYPYIKNSKALLLCSHSEGFPTVLLEAIFLEKPFISTLVGGVTELAEELNCGKIASTPEEFYDIITMYENEDIYNCLVNNCKKAKKHYTLEKQVENFEKVIEEGCKK